MCAASLYDLAEAMVARVMNYYEFRSVIGMDRSYSIREHQSLSFRGANADTALLQPGGALTPSACFSLHKSLLEQVTQAVTAGE